MKGRSWFKHMRFALLAGLAGLLLIGPSAAAAAPSEYEMLDGYLSQYDLVAGIPHCSRVGGGNETAEMPPLPVTHVNATNAFLDHHVAWHEEHTYFVESPDFLTDTNSYGMEFVMFHRHMVDHFDAWRASNGYPPVPVWDPSTPFPPELAFPEACRARTSNFEPVPLPGWLTLNGTGDADPRFGYAKLCDFPDLNRLGKATDFDGGQTVPFVMHQLQGGASYHTQVHQGVGGDLPQFHTSPRDPIFFAWHKFLDQRFQDWERECQHGPEPTIQGPSDESNGKDAPGLPLALGMASLLGLARVRRRS